MKKSKHNTAHNGNKDAMLSNIALLYYGDGLTQDEISKRYKVSRTTIINMLRECRERGIVDIRVNGRFLSNTHLGRDLCQKYGLQDVYVSMETQNNVSADHTSQLNQLARVAAMAVLEIVEPGDKIGVAWGKTITAVAKVIPKQKIEGTEVCQLIGSQSSKRTPTSGFCTIELANKLGAECQTLHAPSIVSSSELAHALKNEPTIKSQLQNLSNLDMTISSVAHLQGNTLMLTAGVISPEELEAAKEMGAKGIFCCRFIDKNGNELCCPPHDRMIATALTDLQSVPKKLLVACGQNKLHAILAAINGKLVTHLVIDHLLAQTLLDA